jgi:tetratricopeptide (TPR) repeat protein
MELAQLYAENNLPEKGIAVYITLIQDDPHAMEFYDKVAAIYIQHDRSKDGLAIYEMAVDVEPEYLKGHLMLGLLYRQHGQPKKSAAHLEIASKLAQGAVEKAPNAGNLDMLASVYHAIGDYVQAEVTLQKALELAPDNEEIHNHLEQVRRLQKREN